jgi:hypothetical protein
MILSRPENPSSEKLQRERIQQLIGRVAKRAKHPYRTAVDKRKKNEFLVRQQKVFASLQEMHSLDRYKEIRKAYWHMGPFQQRKFVDHWETYFYERRTASRPVSPSSRD